MLIVFSGLDGAGKSSQIEVLKNCLESKNIAVTRIWARGGYTPGFEYLKKFMRNLAGRRLPPPGDTPKRLSGLSRPLVAKTWLMISILDLILYWVFYLRCQRLCQRTVICDRYLDDTRLDFRRNFPHMPFENFILWRLLNRLAPKPDLAFLLWTPVEESMRRSLAKNEPFPDDEATLRWRLAEYLNEKNFPPDRYLKVDCTRSLDEVASDIHAALSQRAAFHRRGGAA